MAVKTRWGILATGWIADLFVKDLLLTGHTVTAVGSRSQANADRFAARFGIPNAHSSPAAAAAAQLRQQEKGGQRVSHGPGPMRSVATMLVLYQIPSVRAAMEAAGPSLATLQCRRLLSAAKHPIVKIVRLQSS